MSKLFHDSWVAIVQASLISMVSAIGWALHNWDPNKPITKGVFIRGVCLAALVASITATYLDDQGFSSGTTAPIAVVAGASGQEGIRWFFRMLKRKFDL